MRCTCSPINRPLLGRRLLQALPHQLLDVAAAAEGLARPGHHHHVHVLAVAALGERGGPGVDHGAGEGVAALGPVERDRSRSASATSRRISSLMGALLPSPEACAAGGSDHRRPQRRAAAARGLGAEHLPPVGLVAAFVAPGPEPRGPVVQVVLRGVADGAVHLVREPGDRARRLARPRLGGREGEGRARLRRGIDRSALWPRLRPPSRRDGAGSPGSAPGAGRTARDPARNRTAHGEHLLHRAPQLGSARERHQRETVHCGRQGKPGRSGGGSETATSSRGSPARLAPSITSTGLQRAKPPCRERAHHEHTAANRAHGTRWQSGGVDIVLTSGRAANCRSAAHRV